MSSPPCGAAEGEGMRRLAVLTISLVVGGCAVAPGNSGLATGTPVAMDTPAPTPSFDVEPTQASPTTTPEPTTDPSLLAAATAFASGAGIELLPGGSPIVTDNQRPDYDSAVLRRLSLPLPGDGGLTFDVFFDRDGHIRVVTDGFYNRPPGDTATKADVLTASRRYLDLAGIDVSAGELRVAAGPAAGRWYLTFDRTIDGYAVANAPMFWWLEGDKAYLELRSDASLALLYAIQPKSRPASAILSRAVLDGRLASAAHLSEAELRKLSPDFLWIRAQDPVSGVEQDELTLGYCATERSDSGWQAWCVDAATGEPNAHGLGAD